MAVEIEERLLATDIEINGIAKKDGVIINLNDLSGFIVYLHYDHSKYLQRYATSATLQSEGWRVAEIIDGPAGHFRVKFQSIDNRGGKPGIIFGEFKTEDNVAGWDDSTLHEGSDDTAVVRLVKSISKNDKDLL